MAVIREYRDTPVQSTDAALASAIIATWKNDAAIRAEFGALATYEAYVRGTGKRAEVLAAAARLAPPQTAAKPPVGAPRAPMVIAKTLPTPSAPAVAITIPAVSDREAGYWLSDRNKLHHANALARGLSYTEASLEAQRLTKIDREQLAHRQAAGASSKA